MHTPDTLHPQRGDNGNAAHLTEALREFTQAHEEDNCIRTWDLFPDAQGDTRTGLLHQVVGGMLSQLSRTSETFIGRRFPAGSVLRLEERKTATVSTITEACYIPMDAAPLYDPTGAVAIPTLRIELKRLQTDQGDPDGKKKHVGIYAADRRPAPGTPPPNIADNLKVSYCLMEAAPTVDIQQQGAYADLNASGQVAFSHPAAMHSELQTLLAAFAWPADSQR